MIITNLSSTYTPILCNLDIKNKILSGKIIFLE